MLTLRGAGHPALPVGIEALHGIAAGGVKLARILRRMLLRIGLAVRTLLLVALRIRLAIGMLLLEALRVGLAGWMLLLIALRALLRLLLIRSRVDVVPAAISIRLLPA